MGGASWDVQTGTCGHVETSDCRAITTDGDGTGFRAVGGYSVGFGLELLERSVALGELFDELDVLFFKLHKPELASDDVAFEGENSSILLLQLELEVGHVCGGGLRLRLVLGELLLRLGEAVLNLLRLSVDLGDFGSELVCFGFLGADSLLEVRDVDVLLAQLLTHRESVLPEAGQSALGLGALLSRFTEADAQLGALPLQLGVNDGFFESVGDGRAEGHGVAVLEAPREPPLWR